MLAQDYPDFEIVVCDNLSTDSTWDILERYAQKDQRIRVYRNPENLGEAGNFRRVVQLARGELFRLAAHDDLAAPTLISRCVEALDAHPEAILAFPQTMLIDSDGNEIGPWDDAMDTHDLRSRSRVSWYARKWNLCNEVFGVIRTDVLRKTRLLGPFLSSDVRMLHELALRGEFVQVPQRLFFRRMHATNTFGAQRDTDEVLEWLEPGAAKGKARKRKPASDQSHHTRMTWEITKALMSNELPVTERAVATGAFLTSWGTRRGRAKLGRIRRSITRTPIAPPPWEKPSRPADAGLGVRMSQSVDRTVDPLDRTVDLDNTVEIGALQPPARTVADEPTVVGVPVAGYTVPESQETAEAEDAEGAPRKRLKSAIFWSYALTAGRLGTTTIVTFVLAKMLGPHALGVVTTALLFVMITQMLLQQTLLTTIIQREKLDPDHLDAGFWLVICGSLALTALAAGVAPLWAAFNNQPELTMICIALTPMVLLQGLTVVPEAILRRKMTFRPLAIRTLIATAIGGVVGIAMAFAGYRAWALVAQQLVTASVGAVVLWTVTDWRPRWRLPRQAVKDLWGFSSQTALGGVGVFLAIRMDVLVIGKFFGPNAVGLYRIAQRLPDMLTEVTSRSLQQVSLPELARLQQRPVELGDRLAKMLHVSAVTGLPALGILAATAKPLVALLGPEWSPAGTGMQLLCIVGIVNVYGVLLGPALQAVGRPGHQHRAVMVPARRRRHHVLLHRAVAERLHRRPGAGRRDRAGHVRGRAVDHDPDDVHHLRAGAEGQHLADPRPDHAGVRRGRGGLPRAVPRSTGSAWSAAHGC